METDCVRGWRIEEEVSEKDREICLEEGEARKVDVNESHTHTHTSLEESVVFQFLHETTL